MSIKTAAAAFVAVLGFAAPAKAAWVCSYVQVLDAPQASTSNGVADVELDFDAGKSLMGGQIWWSISSHTPEPGPALMFNLPVDAGGRWSWRPDSFDVSISATDFWNGDETLEISADGRLLYKGPAEAEVASHRGKSFHASVPADAAALAGAVRATKVRVRLLARSGEAIYDHTLALPAVTARDALIRPGVAWAGGGFDDPDVCEEI
ncbi:hypothetical protein [Caulobacter sp. 17J80-11]|uniref:hypothetical protein n=1 Tax=Caulobacter sp. 17J80-11 TaxID=2763502 RepID=UPI001653E38D|nr:hypothetical protein [Caulobacter sp. 17J80-11]MBC6982058.1 hypothetical protein [Caulobacter sp. 17J80-11]